MSLFNLTSLVFVFASFVSDTAFAYIDPGTGSMALQAFIALFFGAAFAIKVYWNKVVGFIRKTKD